MMYGYGNMISPSNRLFSGASPLWGGLLAYYTADNTPNDALGNYNGTLVNGATYGTGIISQGFSLDGVNDTVDFGNVLDFDGSTPFSISVWVKPSSLTSSAKIPLAKALNVTPFVGYWIFLSTSATGFVLANDNPNNLIAVKNSQILTNNVWYNLLVTYDGSKSASGTKLYVNGNLNTQTTLNDTLTGSTSNTASLKFGARTDAFYFGGGVDEVAFFNEEKTALHAVELYNGGAGKQYPL